MFSRGTKKVVLQTINRCLTIKSKVEVMESSNCWFILFSLYVKSDEVCFPVKSSFLNNDCISLIGRVGLKNC
jgi:hypothetical protein